MDTRKLRRWALGTGLVMIVAAIALSLSSRSPDDGNARKADSGQPAEAQAKPALTVTTARPAMTTLQQTLAANGDIAAWQEASIGSEAQGLRLIEVRVNVGDKVRAGEVLAKFSDETVQADVAQARAALMEAQATLAEATSNAERARTLATTGALSTQQINQYQTAEQTAKARVAAAEASMEAQKLRLKFTQLLAPDDGVISFRAATVGAVVPAGTELFRMIRKGRLEWRAEVMATELARVKPGTTARVTAANGSVLSGKVRSIGPTVNPQNRTALVYVDLAPAPAGTAPAKAGMFARGEFDIGSGNALTVPQQAVVVRDGFSYVFRLNADARVSQLKVTTGRYLKDRVEIVDGVTPEAELVTAGAGFLNDGDLVRVSAAQAKVE